MSLSDDELYHLLALQMVPGIGPALAKSLIAYHQNAVSVFQASVKALAKTPGIGDILAHRIKEFYKDEKNSIDREWEFIQKNSIRILPYYSPNFPDKLKTLPSFPSILFVKGNINLNTYRTIAIVGTRKATAYGISVTKKIVEELSPHKVCIVSGLAYGIDVTAHKAALEAEMPTVAVVAHGLERIYPPAHLSIAKKMTMQGGIVSEFFSHVLPDKENFPLRNRIVAGLSDATIVVEAAVSGGALITAEFAMKYHRDVFAVPGRLGDTYSEGTNALIQKGEAHIFTKIDDLLKKLGWDEGATAQVPKVVQPHLFPDLSETEEHVMELIKQTEKIHIDQLRDASNIPLSQLIPILTQLEIKGAIIGLPGKIYQTL